MRTWRAAIAAVVAMIVSVTAVIGSPTSPAPSASAATTPSTLVLYDSTGSFAFLGEQYGMLAANLVSHFGTWTAKPVAQYTAGMMNAYTAVVYLGTTFDEPLPVAFLDDVLAGTKPVVWAFDNIWQLTNRQFAKTGQYWANVRGWDWTGFDTSPIDKVSYKGRVLSRYSADQSGIMNVTVNDPTKAAVLATAIRADGTSFPWATRSGNLTYVGDMPFSYMNENNRYLAFADLLFDALAPTTPERHRALVRIEDVNPTSDPAELRAVADALAAEKVPFSVTVIPEYRDPKGVENGGRRRVVSLWQAPAVVSAIRYMQSKGGTVVMHGYTHQLDGIDNPYNQVSGDDFEFFRAHVDPATNNVVYDGPVPNDSKASALGRITFGRLGFLFALLAQPTIWTTPHYAGSAATYAAVKDTFKARYERALYFSGQLSGGTIDPKRFVGQFFPYPVTDINGQRIVPENLGNEELDAFNNNPPRLPADVIANAAANLVVRDGFASFFWHPYLVGDPRAGVAHLRQIVQGIKQLGYTFVSSTSVANAATPSSWRTPLAAPAAAPDAAGVLVSAVARAVPTAGAAVPVTTVAVRRPAEPVSLGQQLQIDPDEGPTLTVDT